MFPDQAMLEISVDLVAPTTGSNPNLHSNNLL
jgi:hypothetical protein